MKIYVDEMPKSCAECEFCGKLKPPAMQPDIECMHCNLMKKLNAISDFCPLKSLQSELAEKDEEIERLKKEIKEPEEIWNANLAELKEEVKQKLAQEFTEKIDGMLKEKVKEKTIDLNNQIRLMQERQQIEIDKRQREVNSYLKVIKAYNLNENQKAIEQLEKVKEKFGYKHNSQLVISSKNLVGFIDQQINELKGEVKDVKD